MQDIFIVTSVIQTGSQPWSYFPTRSLFSEQERFDQTLQTIQSIRTYSPTSIILLVEASKTHDINKEQLKQSVDHFYDISNHENTHNYCIQSNCKGLGDAYILYKGLEYIKSLPEYQTNQLQNIFKLSGRYCLNSTFDRTTISNMDPTFRLGLTILFSVPASLLYNFIEIVEKVIDTMKQTNMICIERYLPSFLTRICEIDHLGVEGYIAIETPRKKIFI